MQTEEPLSQVNQHSWFLRSLRSMQSSSSFTRLDQCTEAGFTTVNGLRADGGAKRGSFESVRLEFCIENTFP